MKSAYNKVTGNNSPGQSAKELTELSVADAPDGGAVLSGRILVGGETRRAIPFLFSADLRRKIRRKFSVTITNYRCALRRLSSRKFLVLLEPKMFGLH